MILRFLCLTILLCVTACSADARQENEGGDRAEPTARATGGDVAAGDNRVIGTIQATFNGELHTWYVLEANVDGRRESAAFWYEPEPGAPRAMIAGYDTQDVSFDNLGDPTSPLGGYDGSGITLVIEFQEDESRRSVQFPADNQTTVAYMPVMTGETGSSFFQLVEGRLDVTTLDAPRSDEGEIEGTFSGTMRDLFGSDQALAVTDGRFEIEELTYREELPRADRP